MLLNQKTIIIGLVLIQLSSVISNPFSYYVNIVNEANDPKKLSLCGGVLISRSWAISSGRCVQKLFNKAQKVLITAGHSKTQSPEQVRQVQLTRQPRKADIALLRVLKPFKRSKLINFAKLPLPGFKPCKKPKSLEFKRGDNNTVASRKVVFVFLIGFIIIDNDVTVKTTPPPTYTTPDDYYYDVTDSYDTTDYDITEDYDYTTEDYDTTTDEYEYDSTTPDYDDDTTTDEYDYTTDYDDDETTTDYDYETTTENYDYTTTDEYDDDVTDDYDEDDTTEDYDADDDCPDFCLHASADQYPPDYKRGPKSLVCTSSQKTLCGKDLGWPLMCDNTVVGIETNCKLIGTGSKSRTVFASIYKQMPFIIKSLRGKAGMRSLDGERLPRPIDNAAGNFLYGNQDGVWKLIPLTLMTILFADGF